MDNSDIITNIYPYLGLFIDKLNMAYCSKQLYKTFKTMKHTELLWYITDHSNTNKLQNMLKKKYPNMTFFIVGYFRPGYANMKYV
jgi:hypothetical protein